MMITLIMKVFVSKNTLREVQLSKYNIPSYGIFFFSAYVTLRSIFLMHIVRNNWYKYKYGRYTCGEDLLCAAQYIHEMSYKALF